MMISLLSAGMNVAATQALADECDSPEGNKIVNHSFEILNNGVLTGWTTYSGDNVWFNREQTYQRCGNYYGLITSDRVGLAGVYQDVTIDQGSSKVHLSIWAGIHEWVNQEVGLRFLNSAGVEIAGTSQFTQVRNIAPYVGLKKYEFSLDIPDGATKVRVEGRIRRTRSSQSHFLKLDMVSLVFEKDGSLPVTLSAFDAKKLDHGVGLTWQTTMEANSQSFEVLHSMDARSWQKLGSVIAKGEYNGISDYKFMHAQPGNGNNYYRLKSLDRDGTFELSRFVSVYHDAKEDLSSTLFYPNPSEGLLRVNGNQRIAEVKVFDPLGREVLSKSNLQNQDEINLARLTAGTYLLKWVGENGGDSVQRIVLKK